MAMMFHFLFNPLGFVFCAIAFGIALLLGELTPIKEEGPLMIIAGPIVMLLDLGYRWWKKKQYFLASDGGGFIFLPVWQWGLIWLVLGIIYTATK